MAAGKKVKTGYSLENISALLKHAKPPVWFFKIKHINFSIKYNRKS